jgi:hypothetical protein
MSLPIVQIAQGLAIPFLGRILGAALIADYTLTTALVYLSKPYGISSN